MCIVVALLGVAFIGHVVVRAVIHRRRMQRFRVSEVP